MYIIRYKARKSFLELEIKHSKDVDWQLFSYNQNMHLTKNINGKNVPNYKCFKLYFSYWMLDRWTKSKFSKQFMYRIKKVEFPCKKLSQILTKNKILLDLHMLLTRPARSFYHKLKCKIWQKYDAWWSEKYIDCFLGCVYIFLWPLGCTTLI